MTLADRRAFLALPLDERRRILEAQCTEEMVAHYATDPEVQEWTSAPVGNQEQGDV